MADSAGATKIPQSKPGKCAMVSADHGSTQTNCWTLLKTLTGGWPERVIAMQRNWIGKSTRGARCYFAVDGRSGRWQDRSLYDEDRYDLRCQRPDPRTGSSATHDVDPGREHPIRLRSEAKLAEMRQTSVKAEDMATAEKEGFFTGRYAVNPFNGEKIPIWVGNFVLMEYGTGAIMAVPAHDERDFEFATKYGLPIPSWLQPELKGKGGGKRKGPSRSMA